MTTSFFPPAPPTPPSSPSSPSSSSSPSSLSPPFDSSIHLFSSPPTSEQFSLIQQLKQLLINDYGEEYNNHSWCNDHILKLFLIARTYHVEAAYEMIKFAINWREHRTPHKIELQDNWNNKMSKEGETGKIRRPGYDQWGRPIVVLDNSVENTNNIDDQMLFLAWNLESAMQEMPSNIDKFCLFLHLDRFSIWNVPPLAATKETIDLVSKCYPERLGHAIVYQPPAYFEIFFAAVKFLIDPRTASKMIFIRGDVSEGSENDLLLKSIIGPDWKILTGADQPIYSPGASPGYKHEQYWPDMLSRAEERRNRDVGATTPSSGENMEDNIPSSNITATVDDISSPSHVDEAISG